MCYNNKIKSYDDAIIGLSIFTSDLFKGEDSSENKKSLLLFLKKKKIKKMMMIEVKPFFGL